MKTIAIFCKVIIEPKLDWLDSFRAKYDEAYDYHITLKQACYVDESSVADIKAKLEQVLNSVQIPNHQIEIEFDTLSANPVGNDGMCIMLNASDSPAIVGMQKQITTALAEYDNRRRPESKIWEENFKPHITIGRKLETAVSEKAISELPADYTVHGKVSEVILVVVDEYTPAEATNPKNMTIFKL